MHQPEQSHDSILTPAQALGYEHRHKYERPSKNNGGLRYLYLKQKGIYSVGFVLIPLFLSSLIASDKSIHSMFVLLYALTIVYSVAAQSCSPLSLDFSSIADGTSPFDIGFVDVWCGQNAHIQEGKMDLSLNKNCGPELATDMLVQSGKFEVDMETSWGSGVVTALSLFSAGSSSDTHRDEVDMEFVGTDVTTAQTTYFVGGTHVPGATQSVDFYVAPNTSTSRHVYGMEYTPERLSWFIDGRLVHSVAKAAGVAYPSHPMSLHLSLWDATDFSEWAGSIDWDAAPGQTYHANVYAVKVTPYSCAERLTAAIAGAIPNIPLKMREGATESAPAAAETMEPSLASVNSEPHATVKVAPTNENGDNDAVSPASTADQVTSSASYIWLVTCTILLVILATSSVLF